MDNNSVLRGNEQLPQSDYEVETVDDGRNGDAAVDAGVSQINHSNEHGQFSRSSCFLKLYVGGVSFKTTQEMFVNYFRKFGEVFDSVIMKEKISGRPRRYGFVTFTDSDIVDKVLKEEHSIDGCKVDVKRAFRRDIKAVSSNKRKIYVGGLPQSIEQDELKKYFSVYGDIFDYRIICDQNTGRSRGFGFVTFKTEDSVERALSDVKVHKLGGKHVDINRAEPRRHYNSVRGNEQLPPSDYKVETADVSRSCFLKLYVGGVSFKTNQETFANYFQKFGEVVDSIVMTEKISGRPRGFGFVTFVDSDIVDKVLKEEHSIDGCKVDVQRAFRKDIKAVSENRMKIYVEGLPQCVEPDELKKHFSVYGDVIDHHIVYDGNNGRSRGFGFVTFKTEDSVERVLSDVKVHKLGGKRVDINRAEPRRSGRVNSDGFETSRTGRDNSYGVGTSRTWRDNIYGVGTSRYANEDYNNMYSGYEGYGAYTWNPMVNAAGFYGYGYGHGASWYRPYSHMGGGNGVGAEANGNNSRSSSSNSSDSLIILL